MRQACLHSTKFHSRWIIYFQSTWIGFSEFPLLRYGFIFADTWAWGKWWISYVSTVMFPLRYKMVANAFILHICAKRRRRSLLWQPVSIECIDSARTHTIQCNMVWICYHCMTNWLPLHRPVSHRIRSFVCPSFSLTHFNYVPFPPFT